jgi:hypothetical protein
LEVAILFNIHFHKGKSTSHQPKNLTISGQYLLYNSIIVILAPLCHNSNISTGTVLPSHSSQYSLNVFLFWLIVLFNTPFIKHSLISLITNSTLTSYQSSFALFIFLSAFLYVLNVPSNTTAYLLFGDKSSIDDLPLHAHHAKNLTVLLYFHLFVTSNSSKYVSARYEAAS